MIDGFDIEVKLMAQTSLVPSSGIEKKGQSDAEQLIEYAGRTCWGTTAKLGTNPDRIRGWIKVGHESVIEHASATFYVKASRVLTHELVRHRLASYSQRSQRYVKESVPQYITPPELTASGKEALDIFEQAVIGAWNAYSRLLSLGIAPETARYVLPNACDTQIVMTMNFRELRHFIRLRTSKRSLPEMRAVAGEIRRIMKETAPEVFEDL
jgi:thymidylate synthase (FAD)